jgi:putative spermidine/putrescine transport system ATP-binding protein
VNSVVLRSVDFEAPLPAAAAQHEKSRAAVRHAISFRGVSKTYDGRVFAVRNLDLDVIEGEFLTLLGPSGSGKTTSLMMLAGFESPSAGVITLGGVPIQGLPPHKRGLGVVFQNYALFPHMSVAENIGYPLKIRGASRSEIATRVGEVLDLVRLGGFERRKPMQLSGGQQQRIALARALSFRPKVVLMDEPLGALDRKLREQLQTEIKRIHEHLGVTIVYVTHDQSEALTMSDRIAVFHQGLIRQIDTPTAIYERPNCSFVANFLGENNHLHGVVEAMENTHCIVQLDGGARVRAQPGPSMRIGERTTLSIRPEKVHLRPAAAITNRFQASVMERIYLGDRLRVRVSVAGTEDFHIHLETHDHLAAGQLIDIGWMASDCWALDPMESKGS